MADRITKEHRSWNMSRIRGKDTDIEKMVRSYLFSRGFRFRKNDKLIYTQDKTFIRNDADNAKNVLL